MDEERLAQAFDRWKSYDPKRRALMKAALKELKATKGLSTNTYEIVSKALI